MFMKDFIGEARATAIEEDFRNTIEIFKQLTYREVRPWSEFFTQFKIPTWALKNIEQRVTTNVLHYRSNYLIITSIILILQILFAPLVLLSLLVCFILTIYLLIVMKGKSIVIGEVIINEKGKKLVALVLSGVLLLISGAVGQIWWGFMYGIALCGIHAFLRPRNVSSKTNKLYEGATFPLAHLLTHPLTVLILSTRIQIKWL